MQSLKTVFLMLSWAAGCLAAPAQTPDIGRVLMTRGTVSAEDTGGQRRQLQRRDILRMGDILETAATAHLQIRLADQTSLILHERSRLRLSHVVSDGPGGSPDQLRLELQQGGLRAISGSTGSAAEAEHLLITPHGTVEALTSGASYECRLEQALYCGVYNGNIEIRNQQDSLGLGVGASHDFVRVRPGAAPVGLLQNPPALASRLNPANRRAGKLFPSPAARPLPGPSTAQP